MTPKKEYPPRARVEGLAQLLAFLRKWQDCFGVVQAGEENGAIRGEIESEIARSWPAARILVLDVPDAGSPAKSTWRFVEVLAQKTGKPLERGEWARAEDWLGPAAALHFDWLVVDHADRLAPFGIRIFRRDWGAPPAVLIGRSDRPMKLIQQRGELAGRVIACQV